MPIPVVLVRWSVTPSRYPQTHQHRREHNMAMSVLFCIDPNGRIKVLDDGPTPPVTVDADGQLHAK